MFGRTPKDDDTELLKPAMTRILAEMEMYGPDSPEYPKLLKRLEKLMKMRKLKNNRWPSADTLVLAGANVLGILIIVSYEHVHVVTTKAKDYVLNLKTR